MTNKVVSPTPTKTLWGVSTSITIINNFFDTRDRAISYALRGREEYPSSLPSIIDITKYDYYDKLDEFDDVLSVQGLKNWSNRIPYFQMFKSWDMVKSPKLDSIEATAYGMKVPQDKFNEAGVYYLDHVSPYPVPTSFCDYNGTPLDDIYRSFKCQKVVDNHGIRCYKEVSSEKVKELKL